MQNVTDMAAAASDTLGGWRTVDAASMFGSRAALSEAVTDSLPGAIESLEGVAGSGIFADNLFLRLSVLVLFVAYAAIVARYMGHILAVSSLTRGRSYVEKLLDDQNYSFERFVTISNLVGFLIAAIVVVKWLDIMGGGTQIAAAMPQWLSPLGVGVVWLVVVVIRIFQSMVLKVSGNVVMNHRFTAKLIYLRRLTVSLAAVTTAPFVLMLALAPPAAAKSLLIIVLIECCAFVMFFLFRSLILFLEQKISIFYWILYLCAVEIFPLTVPVAIVLRNIG